MSAATTAAPDNAAPSAPPGTTREHKPVVMMVLGMAGSGKTTFVQRLNAHLHERATAPGATLRPPYVINLDPAVSSCPFSPNIDIRDTVDYREVMKQYKLGPNGGILTSLNLFTTKFDQVLTLLETRAPALDHILIDTPGQIEIFTWSASGAIITDALAAALPTVIIYVLDTPRARAPATFMSNMLYACSVLYKARLPLVLALNKTDAAPGAAAELQAWMADFEEFQGALAAARGPDGDASYMNSLVHSMALVLDEFYAHLTAVPVSSLTGDGIPAILAAVDAKVEEYYAEYRPELERRLAARDEKQATAARESLTRVMRDLSLRPEPPAPASWRDTDDGMDADDDDDQYADEGADVYRDTANDAFVDMTRARAVRGLDEVRWPRPG